MKIKSLIAILILCTIVVSLCACGISEDEAIGTWSGSYIYNGNQFSVAFVLSPDGTYAKATYKNGSFHKSESGTWEVDGGDVLLYENGNTGAWTTYEYKGGALVNNDHEFFKK
jgi:hypothetical protein